MNDANKFRIVVIASTALVVLTFAYSILQEYVMPDVEGYLQRKSYYERVIQKKGLSMQKGLYWKEKGR